ncbi:MAG: tRNA lysidine(34) synthetase TilS [Acidimicrobiales bacterium]
MSGGPDSLALLVLAVTAGCGVTAWHVDHGLRAGSEDEAAVVALAASAYGARFRAVHAPVPAGSNLEDRARRARFAALPGGVLTGHTADDQAETLLLAILRGAGVDGLAGMGPGRHPLLALRRADTEGLCAEEGLEVVRDGSNAELVHVRNRVRHQLLPLAAEIAGRDVVPLLSRTAALVRADSEVLIAAAAEIDPTDARALAAATPGSARRAVRAWLVAATPDGDPAYPPSLAAVERVLAVARGEVIACEVAGVGRIARHRQRLVVEGLDVGRRPPR